MKVTLHYWYIWIGLLSNSYGFLKSKIYNLPKKSLFMSFGIEALLFDCDGVIAETERDAHRITFNQAFELKSISVNWDVELYGELLKIGGGKERMTHYFNTVGWPSTITEAEKIDLVKELHQIKTQKFQSVIQSGIVPARPGGKNVKNNFVLH
jgi:hypothetical protein